MPNSCSNASFAIILWTTVCSSCCQKTNSVNDDGADNELPSGRVDYLALAEDVHDDAQVGGAKARPDSKGPDEVCADGDHHQEGEQDEQDAPCDRDDQAAAPDQLQRHQDNVDPRLNHQQDQPDLAHHHKRDGVRHVRRQLWAQE